MGLITLILLGANLVLGSVVISINEFIDALSETGHVLNQQIIRLRAEEAVIAMVGGASLAIGGLMMQSLFRNPLAGPSVLGVSSGASMGVAICLLIGGIGGISLPLSAVAGALIFLLILLLVSTRVKQNVTLLIIGLLFGYGISAVISLLEYFAQAESLKKYVIWGMGSFFPSDPNAYVYMTILCIPVIMLSFLMIKPLDALLLGEESALSLGINARKSRNLIILITGWLTGVVTAFCGPIAFLGLMIPHIARFFFKTASHKRLLMACVLMGSSFALLANIIAKLPFVVDRLPVNIITSVLGIPVIIWIILDQRRIRVIA